MDNQAIIEQFADALWMERGLAKNTLNSYQSDLRDTAHWLESEQGVSLLEAGRGALLAYLGSVASVGASARTSARRLSALRQFFQYALRESWISVDPTLEIEAPKLGRPLPKTLTEQDVEMLLAAPDLGTAEGFRDRVMLEVLYATGLRVSELVMLGLDQVSLSQGLVRVTGKGGKERLVPMGDEAFGYGGYPQTPVSPYPAARICHSPGEPWSRSQGGAIVARA